MQKINTQSSKYDGDTRSSIRSGKRIGRGISSRSPSQKALKRS